MSEAGRRIDLGALLDRWWPAVAARVGERREAFLQAIEEKATQRAFDRPVDRARFANLCFCFGPGFEARPEHEWALALLLDSRLSAWVRLHQLVVKSQDVLRRRPEDGKAQAEQIRLADSAVLDAFDPPTGAAPTASDGADDLQAPPGAGSPDEAARLARHACDIEAAEFRLLDVERRREYVLAGDSWQLAAVNAPAPVRIDSLHPAPDRLTVLTEPPGDREPLRLQVRQASHGRCSLHRHPSMIWYSLDRPACWQEHAAVTVALPLRAPAIGPEPRLLREGWPEITRVDLETCGLRDEGVPIGPLGLRVWSYPAHQHLVTFDREARHLVDLPGSEAPPPAAAPTRWRLERDGDSLPTQAWALGFDQDLPDTTRRGMAALFKAWQSVVQGARLRSEFSLWNGSVGLTWGLREGARGISGPPVLRVIGLLKVAALLDLTLSGFVEHAGVKANLRLSVQGQSRLDAAIERLHAESDLIAAMAGAQLRWRWPVSVEADPIAGADGAIVSEVGPCTGAITGALGLRPSVTVGGAWEWFASLAVEPVSARVVLHDPLLGRSETQLALLGSIQLLDWSLA